MALNSDDKSIDLGDGVVLHVLFTDKGKMFSMSEVAVELFRENPGAFGKELRLGRYRRLHSLEPKVLQRISQLHIPSESHTVPGATLIPPETLQTVLTDKRRDDLVPKLKIGMLKLVAEEAAILIGNGQHEAALPVAMEAISQGQKIFYPSATVELVPIYLVAIQANLGLGRTIQAGDLLGVAAWLLLQASSDEGTNCIRSELSRLFGQLYVLEEKFKKALKAFSEEVYYSSLEHGVMDVRTSLGFYSLSNVFLCVGNVPSSMACVDVVVDIWLSTLKEIVMGFPQTCLASCGERYPGAPNPPTKAATTVDSMNLKEIANMFREILTHRKKFCGAVHVKVAETDFVLALTLILDKEYGPATGHLMQAQSVYKQKGEKDMVHTVGLAMKFIPNSKG